jgi:hypothetical protein
MLKMVKTHILRNHQKKVLLFMTFGRVINIFSSSLRFAKWQFTQARYKKVLWDMRPREHCWRDASLQMELCSARLAETFKTLGTVTFPPQLRLLERLHYLPKHWSSVPEDTYTNKHIRGFALHRLFAVYSVSFRNTLTRYTRVLTRLWRPLFQSPNKSLQNALPGFLRIPVEGYQSLVLYKRSFVESRIPE